MTDDQAAQWADECARQERIDQLLRAVVVRTLTRDEQRELAIETGIGTLYRRDPELETLLKEKQ